MDGFAAPARTRQVNTANKTRVARHAVLLYEAQQRHALSRPIRDRQRDSLRLLLAECVEAGRVERREAREGKP